MISERSVVVLIVALVMTLPVIAAGQGRAPEISTTIEPTTINVGDPVTITATVRHAPDARVIWPDPIALGPFELLDQRESDPAPNADEAVALTGVELQITAFELGELALPSFDVEVVAANGDTVTLSTEPAAIEVASVGRDEGGTIRDIKGPLAIPFGMVTLLPWLAGLVVLAILGYWLYRRYRRRARPEVVVPTVPPRPAHELAYESLDALEASGLLELGEIKTYHIRVSDIVRVYAEGRFRIDAMEMTTSEVLTLLGHRGVSRSIVADFRQVLDRCDLVKFAKFRPEAAACRDLVPLGRRLVDLTRPAKRAPTGSPEAHAA